MPRTLDLMRLVTDVRGIAAANPDHVYERIPGTLDCFYDRDADGVGPEHGCLIGQGIAEQVPFDGEWETFEGAVDALILSGGRFDVGDWEPDDRPLDWLLKVQIAQDDVHPWAAAVNLADEDHPLAGT